MSKNNTQIVKEFIEEVFNNKKFEKAYEYCSKDCKIHITSYIGIGFNSDDSSGKQIIVTEVAPNGPATGKLQVNDEVVAIRDEKNNYQTFKEISEGTHSWGQGVMDSQITLTILRDGMQMEITLKRGKVEGFDLSLAKNLDIWKFYTTKIWQDLRSEFELTCAEGDLVAFYLLNTGTNLEYNRSAIWSEVDIYRLEDGKIIEMWGVEDTLSEFKQLGYLIRPPAK